jgi:ABC-type transporter Mla subunit MlaD
MNEEPRYFQIGLFVVVGLLLLAGVLITFGAGRLFEPRINFETYLSSSVSGIDVGSPVRFRGVTIGKVTQVTFVFNEYPDADRSGEYNYVILVFEVSKAVFPNMFELDDLHAIIERAVNKGLRARIEPQGITGLNYVEMDFLNPTEFPPLTIEWTPKNYYVPSAPGQLAGILDSVNKIMRDIEKLRLGEIEEGLRTLLDNLNKAVVEADLGAVSEQIRGFTASAEKLVTDLDRVLAEADLPKISEETQVALQAVTRAVNDLQIILTNVEPATRLNSDDVEATLSNLRIISDNLRVLSGELRADPARLLFSAPPPRLDLFEEDEEPAPTRPRRPASRR